MSAQATGRLRRALVTGANGFVGHHVVAELRGRGCAVIAVSRQDTADDAIAAQVESYLSCDVADPDEVRRLPLDQCDTVINLAGLAAVGESFSRRDLYLQVNVGVIDAVCTVALERGLDRLRVVAVSSGAVYAGGQSMPLSEDSATEPTSSPYSESKLAMEERARHYRGAGVDCVIVRPFNHIGPGQRPGFLVPDLFGQIEQARTTGGVLRVGNLTTRRDYTDVRDVARAYGDLAAAPSLPHGLFNVCSGRSLSGEGILSLLLSAMGQSGLDVEADPARFRPSDSPEIVGTSSRLAEATGWTAVVEPARSVRDFVAWRMTPASVASEREEA